MRSLHLLEFAAQAEILRLKREGGSMARSVLLMVVAGLLGLIVLGLLHAAAWIWLSQRFGYLASTLCLALGDLILVGIFYALSRKSPDPVAHEALVVRRQAMAQLRASLAVRQLLLGVTPRRR
jgi:hypothetical protein